MENGEPGPLGGPAALLVEEEIKQGAELAITQHLTLEELRVWGHHLRTKYVPPKIAL